MNPGGPISGGAPVTLSGRPMHPATARMLRNFGTDDLVGYLGAIASSCTHLAHEMADRLPTDDPETIAGLRKLLEARDCFLRAAAEQQRRMSGEAH